MLFKAAACKISIFYLTLKKNNESGEKKSSGNFCMNGKF